MTIENGGAGTGGFTTKPMPATAPVGDPKITAFGHAIWLMTHSPIHKHLFMTDADWLVLPAISLEQYKLWTREGRPYGFASWAFLGPDAEARIKQGIRRIMPIDWKSGDALWLIDFIAPFGGQQEMLAELRQHLGGRPLKSLQPGPDGKLAVMEW